MDRAFADDFSGGFRGLEVRNSVEGDGEFPQTLSCRCFFAVYGESHARIPSEQTSALVTGLVLRASIELALPRLSKAVAPRTLKALKP